MVGDQVYARGPDLCYGSGFMLKDQVHARDQVHAMVPSLYLRTMFMLEDQVYVRGPGLC